MAVAVAPAQLGLVVEFAVAHDRLRAGRVHNRLPAPGDVHDREPGLTQYGRPVDHRAGAVGSAVAHPGHHALDGRLAR